ncbi:hypothetical protein CFSAN002368_12858 [Clostridium botulinum A1 str. CFSAN002368]|nr:hypothetical protein CFSAN002368_12858 [Clostridium botulinum A1 str. CFSAN002368]
MASGLPTIGLLTFPVLSIIASLLDFHIILAPSKEVSKLISFSILFMLSIFKESLINFKVSSVLTSLALTIILNSLFFFTVPFFNTAVKVIFSSLFALLTTPVFERILLLLDLHSILTLFFHLL